MQLHDSIIQGDNNLADVRRVLLWSNIRPPRSVANFIKQIWPKSHILTVIKGTQDRPPLQVPRYHEYRRKSTMSIPDYIRLILRLRKCRVDVVLLKKHELSIKLLLGIILLHPQKVLLWKNTYNEVILSGFELKSLFLMPFQKKYFLLSLVGMLLPLGLLLLQLPLVLFKRTAWAKKKEILRTIKNNISRGPLADNPWLFGWLQVIMIHMFLFDKKSKNKTPSRILVIRIDHIGDTVNTVPLIRHLRKTYPSSKITVLCDTGSFLWDNCPYVDEVLLYKSNNQLFHHGRNKLRYVFRPLTFFPQLHKRKFDLVLDPVGRTETHILSYLCRGAHRINSTYYPYHLFDITTPIRHYETQLHESLRPLALVKPIDEVSQADRRLEFWLTPEAQNKAKNILATNHIGDDNMLLGIHPGATSPLRCWPIERMAIVAHTLAKKYGMDIVFFEPPDDNTMTSNFTAHLARLGIDTTVIRGIDLNVLTALIARCSLFICCDSGPMHLAATTKTPQVTIFGPGEYWRWQPFHCKSIIVRKPMSCSPCSQNNCSDPQCILSVQIQDVLQAAESILTGHSALVKREWGPLIDRQEFFE